MTESFGCAGKKGARLLAEKISNIFSDSNKHTVVYKEYSQKYIIVLELLYGLYL